MSLHSITSRELSCVLLLGDKNTICFIPRKRNLCTNLEKRDLYHTNLDMARFLHTVLLLLDVLLLSLHFPS